MREILTKGFLAVLALALIFSLALSGYQNQTLVGTDSVATVNGKSIDLGFFNRNLEQQLQFYSQVYGRSLTAQQIRTERIKDKILNSMIERKIITTFGEDIGTVPGDKYLEKEILALPYFQTNNQFDYNKYQNLLSYNKKTPKSFEEEIRDDMTAKNTEELLENFPVSKAYVNEMLKIKKEGLSVTGIKISKTSLRNQIPVTDAEIQTLLKSKEGLDTVKSRFDTRKDSLNKDAQFQASHILLTTQGKDENEVLKKANELKTKISTANFAKMANDNTEDPSGKGKGGDLGWFDQSAMVPEFTAALEKMKDNEISAPVKSQFGYHIILRKGFKPAVVAKLETYQNQIAKEVLQEKKQIELKNVAETIQKELITILGKGDTKLLKETQKKYNFAMEESAKVNKLDGRLNSWLLSEKELTTIFSTIPGQVANLSNDAEIFLVSTKSNNPTKEDEAANNFVTESTNIKTAFARELRNEYLATLKSQATIKINPGIID